MPRKARVFATNGRTAVYARFWPVLLIPALSLGWYLGSAMADLTSDLTDARPSAFAMTPRSVWKFNPAEHKGFVITSNGASITTGDGMAILRGDSTPTGYQFVSDPIQVRIGAPMRLTWKMRAASGRMAVGVMNGHTGQWIHTMLVTDKAIDAEFVPNGTVVVIMVVNDNSTSEPPIAELGPGELVLK